MAMASRCCPMRNARRGWKRLRAETTAALAGAEVAEPAFKAFQRVAIEHRLATAWPLEMLDGFAMDVDHVAYPTMESTLRYCWGVAGVVGVMMASIMGVADEAIHPAGTGPRPRVSAHQYLPRYRRRRRQRPGLSARRCACES